MVFTQTMLRKQMRESHIIVCSKRWKSKLQDAFVITLLISLTNCSRGPLHVKALDIVVKNGLDDITSDFSMDLDQTLPTLPLTVNTADR